MIPSITRGFVSIEGGQIHYREAGPAGGRPLVLIHASPGSSKMLEPMILAFADDRKAIGLDTVGNGDSLVKMPEQPEIAFFARCAAAAIDALGIERFDLYGTHTGAAIAAEIALAHSGRVCRLILDGSSVYPPEFAAELLERYAPAVVPDLQGMYLAWVWHFVRDTFMFWPWYRTDAAHRRPTGLPPARALHDKVVEVLKAVETYHHSYRAAFRYDKRARLPMLAVPTLAACAADDMLARWHDEFAALIPGSRKLVAPGTASPQALAQTVALFRAFLDAR